MGSIIDVISATRTRLRILAAIDAFGAGLGPALGVAATAQLGAWEGLVGQALATEIAVGAAGALAAVIAAAAAWPRSDLFVARRIDVACRLRDRVTTALELGRETRERDPVTEQLVRAAIRDAELAISPETPRRAAPFRAPAGTHVSVGVLAVVVAVAGFAAFVPAPTREVTAAGGWGTGHDVDIAGAMSGPGYAPFDLGHAHAVVAAFGAAHPELASTRCDLDEAIDLLAAGSIDKQELLARLDRAAARLPEANRDSALADVDEALRRLHRRALPPAPTPTPAPAAVADVAHSLAPSTSRREAVLVAARAGFASVPYRKVYADYHRAVEDTLHAEQVPSSYRYVVSRYFYKIQPTCAD